MGVALKPPPFPHTPTPGHMFGCLPGHVDSASIFETLHRRADGRFQLDDPDATLQSLGVDDDLHVQGVALHQTLDRVQVHPEVVGVEVLELLDRLELVLVNLRNLSNLEKAKLSFILEKYNCCSN